MKIMASSPITSWQIDGETVETVRGYIFLGSKITADGDCSHEIKRRLLLGRKVMINLDSIFKSRDITLSTKVRLVKAMVFPVVMYGCESWTVRKAEHQRIDAFELWCWRRLLKIPWTARRSNQSILKDISPPMNTQDWFSLGWTGWIFLQSKDSQESSPTPQFKSISSALSFLYCPTLSSIHDYWKNHSLVEMDLCWQSNVSAFEYAV